MVLAQKDRKQLNGLRDARERQLRKLEHGRGFDPEGHWRRVLDGIERDLRDILRRHPNWRQPGDP
jgi:hypothetical protein